MTLRKWAIFIMGVYGEISHFLSDPTESFFISGYIKSVDTHNESFSSKKTSNKKVIAQKPLTNLYEMNSRCQVLINSTVNHRHNYVCPCLDNEMRD